MTGTIRWLTSSTMTAGLLSLGLGTLPLGCASVPLADSTADAQAKQFVAPSSTAIVYVVREGATIPEWMLGSGFKDIFRIVVAGREVGVLAPWTYLALEVPPGTHTITATGPENQDRLTVTTEPGRLVFVRVISRTGFAAGRAELSKLTEPAGRDLVRRSSLVQP
jgi:hypothetical protein